MSQKLHLLHALMSLKDGDLVDFLAKIFVGLAQGEEDKGNVAANVFLQIGERLEALGLEPGEFRHVLMTAYAGRLMADLGTNEAADEIEGLARFIREQYVPTGEVN
ncbi:MAG: hypothetical protein ACOZAM_23150 [Pseudomonadota bacterium]